MRKNDIAAAMEVGLKVGRPVETHPPDGSVWVLWISRGHVYLRETQKPGTIQGTGQGDVGGGLTQLPMGLR